MRQNLYSAVPRSTHNPTARRAGVVLLVVLGMLSLFTVLIVSFVVFSSQVADSSRSSEERRITELLPEPPIDGAILQLIVGTNDSKSAAFGNSFMEDYFGGDGQEMRVGHRRGGSITPPESGVAYPPLAGGQLLLPRLGNGRPQTTLFKFPTNLAYWHYDGNSGVIALPPGRRSDGNPITRITTADVRYNALKPFLDDAFSGRILTFVEGPLAKISFRLIRTFGIENGTPDSGVTVNNAVEYGLAGNFVIDLSEIGEETIMIDGVPEQLYDIAENDPNRLLYDPGADGLPGMAGNRVFGAPGSDDIGYRFILNGGVFNGRGVNPSGLTGVDRGTLPADPGAEIEFTFNTRLTGAAYRGGTANPELDEAWDAADWENLFLAWQPSDHRRPILNVANQVYTGVDAAELNRQLGQHVIPSFHRPSIINYLMNAPIYIPDDFVAVSPPRNDPTGPNYIERTFADIRASAGSPLPDDLVRLQYLVTRIRRATLRPLNFPHEYSASLANDLNGDGDPFDGSPEFSGSNPVSILNQTIDLTAPLPTVVTQIEQLARWLINGPWDVDNDGDGLPDSVWVDFNLPVVAGPDGKLLKPMLAPLIEDMDGRINVTYAGSYNQLFNDRFRTGPTNPTNNAQYDQTNLAVNSFGFGGGIGPAEIDFSHLFDSERTPPLGYLGPLSTNQVGAPLSLDQVLLTRYGNLLNVRYGGPVYNYASTYPYQPPTQPFPPINPLLPNNIFPYPFPYATPLSQQFRATQFLHYPGAGNRLFPAPNSDLLSRIPFPTRRIQPYAADSAGGRPVDIAGTERVSKDQYGIHRFNPPPLTTDVINQPYEFGATEIRGDDAPFSPAEYVDFLAGGPLSGRLSQLLGDAADRNEALRRLVTTESRAVDSPEVPGQASLLHMMAERFAEHAARTGSAQPAANVQSTLLNRMLAVELRKGSKLNLNRQLGNAVDTNSDGFNRTDEHDEVRTGLMTRSAPRSLSPVAAGTPTWEANQANNRRSVENAFPQILGQPALPDYANQSQAPAHYGPTNLYASASLPAADQVPDFNGIDVNGDGDYADAGEGTDFDGDGEADQIASGSELLARNLYCLMFALVAADIDASGELVPNYPYPGQLSAAAVPVKNRYVARQLAQWAANAVDYRDTDSSFTRLRYDPNPFDGNGFNLTAAANNVVWGVERPEVQITETFAMHDKRLKRNLPKQITQTGPNRTADGEMDRDDDTDTGAIASDSDMDQFRKPQGSAFVEIQALAPPMASATGEFQPSLPRDLYTAANQLDLARVVGAGATASPVWRMAVGQRHNGDHNKSSRWIFDADRLVDLNNATNVDIRDAADYLTSIADWTPGADPDTQRNTWNQVVRYGADIRHSGRLAVDPPRSEFVTLSDDDFDPTTDAGNPSRIRLQRFVWFAELSPAAGLNIVNHPDSGMRVDNVYFNKPAGVANTIHDAPALLLPGQYAIVAPRITTYFGQKSLSARDLGPNAPPGPNSFIYDPSDQKLELLVQAGGAPEFRLNYFRNGDPDVQTPYYLEDNGGNYHVNRVLPIVCQSLYPNEIPGYVPDPANYDWADYAGIPVAEKVDMGFNISEPLPGQNYYLAPEYRINNQANAAGNVYPHRDGYRDYTGAGTGFHPDTPLDHLGTAPLAQNNHEWAAVGTHQEAATIFLQRLADPTVPWHPKNNPYITVDFMPMDLTTFNGEEDVRQGVNRQIVDAGGNPANFPDDSIDDRTTWTAGFAAPADNGFTPLLRLDSRRKIPDLVKDRGLTSIIPGGGGRVVCAHRSFLSMTTSVMRDTRATRATPPAAPSAVEPHFPFNLGAMWDNGVNTPSAGLVAITQYDDPSPSAGATSSNLRFDNKNLPFTQSLGFVNREYGEPLISNSPRQGVFGTGSPDLVFMLNIPWMNREYQSPYDLMNVPAVSRTRLLSTFSPETMIQDTGLRELPRNVWESLEQIRTGAANLQESHLLGFDTGLASHRNEDGDGQYAGGRLRVGVSENDSTDFDDWTGGRAGFEMIFDYVDVGPVWFDSQRWFDPANIQFRNDVTFDSAGFALQQQHRMFNRSVETLQPPNNYIGRHRTPGKINLNTSPDYIRKGPNFDQVPGATPALQNRLNSEFLDGIPTTPGLTAVPLLENPENAVATPSYPALISSAPQNDSVRGDGLTAQYVGSRLFGNGSVYRSLAWGISNPFELDNVYGAPTTLGDENRYFGSVDTSFGRGFKAFIESRRGYDRTMPGTLFGGPGRNPELDYRYPTRFAGVFAPAAASSTPSLQRFMRTLDRSQSAQPSGGGLPPSNQPVGVPRRMHDMSLLRPHPDFDLRTMPGADRNAVATAATDTRYSLGVETQDAGGFAGAETPPTPEVANLRMPLVNAGLFERPQAELHMNRSSFDRDSYFRYKNAARLANVTTHHSNVFLVRLTLSYFEVDATTGAVGAEYISNTGEPIRSRGTYLIDRTIPIGFLRGQNVNAEETILYAEVEQ